MSSETIPCGEARKRLDGRLPGTDHQRRRHYPLCEHGWGFGRCQVDGCPHNTGAYPPWPKPESEPPESDVDRQPLAPDEALYCINCGAALSRPIDHGWYCWRCRQIDDDDPYAEVAQWSLIRFKDRGQ